MKNNMSPITPKMRIRAGFEAAKTRQSRITRRPARYTRTNEMTSNESSDATEAKAQIQAAFAGKKKREMIKLKREDI